MVMFFFDLSAIKILKSPNFADLITEIGNHKSKIWHEIKSYMENSNMVFVLLYLFVFYNSEVVFPLTKDSKNWRMRPWLRNELIRMDLAMGKGVVRLSLSLVFSRFPRRVGLPD